MMDSTSELKRGRYVGEQQQQQQESSKRGQSPYRRRDDNDSDTNGDKSTDGNLSEMTKRLNLYGNERERGVYDIHGIGVGNDTDHTADGPQSALSKEAYEQEFLQQMGTFVVDIVNKNPEGALAKAMSISKEYVTSQQVLFFRSAPSTTLNWTLQQHEQNEDEIKPTPKQQSPTKEGPDALAKRLEGYFELKCQHFGEACLGRDLLLSDLTEEDRAIWNTGFTQITSDKDSAGRAVTISFSQIRNPPVSTSIRIHLYKYQILSKDMDVQRLGLVDVTYAVGSIQPAAVYESSEFHDEITKFDNVVPVRCRAFHIVYSNPKYEPILQELTGRMNLYLACRYRQHLVKSHEDGLLILQTFGIRRLSVPIRPWTEEEIRRLSYTGESAKGGNENSLIFLEDYFGESPPADSNVSDSSSAVQKYFIETDFHLGFLEAIEKHEQPPESLEEQQYQKPSQPKTTDATSDQIHSPITVSPTTVPKTISKTEPSSSIIVLPGPMDIELGRGAIYHNRTKPGYLRYRMILDNDYDRYNETPRQDRAEVVNEILFKLDQAGIRFVRPLPSSSSAGDSTASNSNQPICRWEVVQVSDARDKITHDMRNVRKASK